MRGPTNSDYNVLLTPKCSETSEKQSSELTNDALIFFTVLNEISWKKGAYTRHSQHVILASQSLGDLFEKIACSSNEIQTLDADPTNHALSSGACICIESKIYGDGRSVSDYSE